MPIVLEQSEPAQFLIPLAVSLAFGVLASTPITLVLVPALYLIVEDLRRLLGPVPGRHADAARDAVHGDFGGASVEYP